MSGKERTCFCLNACIKNRFIASTRNMSLSTSPKCTFPLWSITHSDDWQYWPKYLLLHYHSLIWNIQDNSWSNLSAMKRENRWYDIIVNDYFNLNKEDKNATHNFFSSLWPPKTILWDTLSSSKSFTSRANWFGDTIRDMSFESIRSFPKNFSNSSFKAFICCMKIYQE